MARRSSSTSDPGPRAAADAAGATADEGFGPAAGLFGPIARRGLVPAEVDDRAWLQAMLDAEAALARAEASVGLVPFEHAETIAAACDVTAYDVDAIGQEAAADGVPVSALVRALTGLLETSGWHEAAGHVHRGATSQDVMDTAAMLVARRALDPLLADLRAAGDAAAALADAHCRTPMAARTLLQQALPTTFGYVAAGWLGALDRAVGRLEMARGRLAVQLGGAAGTLASLGSDGPRVLESFAGQLGLAAPDLPWQTDRTRVVELAAALGEAAAAAAKAALDVVLLAQTEIGEVREGVPGRGASSTLPQKRNPVAAVATRAAAARVPGLVATIFMTSPQELQRGAGGWQAEWVVLSDLLVAVGSAAAWLRDCLEHLEVDPARMQSNLAAGGGLIVAEGVAVALEPALGRAGAREAVREAAAAAANGGSFAAALAGHEAIRGVLEPRQIDELLDPTRYLGSVETFAERAVARHRALREASG